MSQSSINYINRFKEYDLDLLGIILTYFKPSIRDDLLRDINSTLSLDLTKEEVLDNLTPGDITALQEFQTKKESSLLELCQNLGYNDDSPSAKHHRMLDWLILGVGFFYIFFILVYPISESAVRFADTILGVVVGTMLTSVVAYWYDGTANKKGKKD